MTSAEHPIPAIDRRRQKGGALRCAGSKRCAGFTLIEALVASVVLAILVLGVCATVGTSYEQSEIVRANSNATALARQLADEITAKPLADPSNGSTALGPGGFTTRSAYTHVTNYDGYTDTSTSMPLLAGGTLDVTSTDAYTRTAAVVVGAKPSIDTASPTTDFAIVTVTVTAPTGQKVTVSKLVPKYQIIR